MMTLTLKIDAALLVLIALVCLSAVVFIGVDSETDVSIYIVVSVICSILSTVVITIDHRLGLLEKAASVKTKEPNVGDAG